jgi:hypothetical protein
LDIAGTTHGSFTDMSTLLYSLNTTFPAAVKEMLEGELGTMEFGRSRSVVAGIVSAFAELVLGGEVGSIFAGGDGKFPEVKMVRGDI